MIKKTGRLVLSKRNFKFADENDFIHENDGQGFFESLYVKIIMKT